MNFMNNSMPMKAVLILIAFTTIILLGGCKPKPSVLFLVPQPENEKDQIRFKNKFIGTYLSKSDSSILYITSGMIIREQNMRFGESLKHMDSGYVIKNDSLFGDLFPGGVPIKIENDCFYVHSIFRDTIFNISGNNILRFYKGNYFLNYRYNKDNWEVKTLEFINRHRILISDIKTPEIDKLKNATEVKSYPENGSDSNTAIITYIAKPTKKELKKFMKSGGFSGSEEFVKVRLGKR